MMDDCVGITTSSYVSAISVDSLPGLGCVTPSSSYSLRKWYSVCVRVRVRVRVRVGIGIRGARLRVAFGIGIRGGEVAHWLW
jgi:hypothetical protein